MPSHTAETTTPRGVLETKYRISETAMALFLEQGYGNVTVEAVADAAQVSRRTVFRHFDGKDELPFPDHREHLAQVQQTLLGSDPDGDPVETVVAATEASLRSFLSRPDLVLRRFQLTRIVPELRDREVIEHERYVRMTHRFLRDRLPADGPPFQPLALAALIDAMHRSALGNYARSGGASDALGELEAGMLWVRTLLQHSAQPARSTLLAVLPDTAGVRRALSALRDSALDEL